MPFTIVRQDITKLKVDAIVNAANTALQMGGGVCGAIFKAAGSSALQAACDQLAPIKTGEAVITPGFELPARFIIHAAGPVYKESEKKQSEQHLRHAYFNSLELAVQNGCESIAFPLISSGIYGYPKGEALKVATASIQDFLMDHELDVTLAVFDKSAFTISSELMGEVDSYIDEHYVEEYTTSKRRLLKLEQQSIYEMEDRLEDKEIQFNSAMPIDEWVENLDEPFSVALLKKIDEKKKTDVEVYKRANIDRKLFSKIRTGKGYVPSKKTVIALAVALELSLDETNDLLKKAGYALSHSHKFDVIIEYFITSGKYDIFEINEVLFKYDQALLGS
ncbi:macro domain-containing protein [Jeotgalibacillus sp. R-1-5s-1]|uniref:macro domain-containing protein n=1 Tax=Jeotgalibacillus sp. R-1-5s-1 TaxID=2555897 RepID=UPI00106BF309|nr:macro domain-containing protein [Jeotgalibacillus sp. R-1-5s-1]TFE01236.1 RNase III inhibitor [Jeotgalibacillus sp. R-1-5s-1]